MTGRVYSSPTYRTMAPPTGPGVLWLLCEFCGAFVADREGHTIWHTQLWSALNRETAPARVVTDASSDQADA